MYLKDKKFNFNLKEKILPKMKELVALSYESVKSTLNPNDRKYCFEIFGYDFIIDSLGNVWLIEVNTNPCIEESSPLLKSLIPRMLGTTFTSSHGFLLSLRVGPSDGSALRLHEKCTTIMLQK